MDGQTNNDVALIELVFMMHLQLQRKSRKKTFGTRKTMSIKKKKYSEVWKIMFSWKYLLLS